MFASHLVYVVYPINSGACGGAHDTAFGIKHSLAIMLRHFEG
jgi:hypothetical protein